MSAFALLKRVELSALGEAAKAKAKSSSLAASAFSSIKFSPDGKWLATTSTDGLVRVWEARSLQLVHELEGHVLGVNDVSWSPDSRWLASASDDATVLLWDVLAGEAVRTLRGHTNYVMCVAWSPVGNLLATGSYDESVRIWDSRSGVALRTLPAHSDPVVALDFARDGSVLVTGSYDGLVRLWDPHSGQCLTTLADEKESVPVTSVRFTPNAQFVLVGTLNGALRLVRVLANKQWRVVKHFAGHRNARYALLPSVDAGRQWLLCGSEASDNGDKEQAKAELLVWDVNSRRVLHRIGATEHARSAAVIAVDTTSTTEGESLVATADLSGTLCLWRIQGQ